MSKKMNMKQFMAIIDKLLDKDKNFVAGVIVFIGATRVYGLAGKGTTPRFRISNSVKNVKTAAFSGMTTVYVDDQRVPLSELKKSDAPSVATEKTVDKKPTIKLTKQTTEE